MGSRFHRASSNCIISRYLARFLVQLVKRGVCRHHCQQTSVFFGCFSDALPDRWGRTLLKRRDQQEKQACTSAWRHQGCWDNRKILQCKLFFELVKKKIIYVKKEDIQMPGMWVRDRNIWGTWFHGAAHWSHVLSRLQEHSTSSGGWSDRWCCT